MTRKPTPVVPVEVDNTTWAGNNGWGNNGWGNNNFGSFFQNDPIPPTGRTRRGGPKQ